ncbi:hypothetical protein LCGC14_1203430 [marine sediment metagenome]|uniref:Uncharacterized protein n=1 Tax=marine sediment metagenome TaxID=412755 RepID=A0A0F9NYM3_9ZZZZ
MPDDAVTWEYVNKLLQELQGELRGFHTRVKEVEELRYLEDEIKLPAEEKASGLEIRLGATADLIEQVKAALTANSPRVILKPLRTGPEADENSSKREKFWDEYLQWASALVPFLVELADSQTVALGILKAAYYPWPKTERRRTKDEPRTKKGDDDYKDRQRALKRRWGPPFKVITIHPLTFYFRLGPGGELSEVIEHGYKSRREIYAAFGIHGAAQLNPEMPEKIPSDLGASVAAVAGYPTEEVQSLPSGLSTSTLALVTEYWAPDQPGLPGIYQCYIDGNLVYEEIGDPSVAYFACPGRTTSSKDPDKFALSIAEVLRHNEPTLNRSLTYMAEATELLVRRRLTLEVPEGYMPPAQLIGDSNEPQTKTWTFKADKAEALPAGAVIKDPFEGVENVYMAMPFINLMLQLLGEHGVSPIFRGVPSGAGGSGYKENSLYLMAKSQFQYLLDSYARCVGNLITWLEHVLVTKAKQEVLVGNLSLTPKDIKAFPALIGVDVEPLLPQNIIAEGQFWDRMHARGHVTRRTVLEQGLRKEQPEQELWNRFIEDVQEMLKPLLVQDVLQTVGVMPPMAPGLVGPDGQTPIGGPRGAPGPAGGDGARGNAVEEIMKSMGGRTREGQARQPPEEAGSTPGREEPLE